MDRRTFSRMTGVSVLGIASGCLDVKLVEQPKVLPMPRLLPGPQVLGNGVASVAISQWPSGADAAVIISADDLCPLDLGGDYDFGGSWSNVPASGIVTNQVEAFVLNLLDTYPLIRFSFNTVTAMRFDPRTNESLQHSYSLSGAGEWLLRLREIQESRPGFVLGLHGYSHYDAIHGGPGEFKGYDPISARVVLDRMEAEVRESRLRFTRGFRPPGWALTGPLIEELATRRYVLGDNSRLPTYTGVRPSYIRTAAGNWLFRIGVTFELSAEQTFAQGGLFEAHHHLTPPNVNTLTDPAIRDRLGRFLERWYHSSDPLLAWLSADEVYGAYCDAAAIQWVASLDGMKVTIAVLNPEALKPGITWVTTSNQVNDIEILVAGVKLGLNVRQRTGVLTASLTA